MSQLAKQRGAAHSVPVEPEVIVRDASFTVRRADELVLTWSISRVGAAACGMVKETSGPPVKLEVRMAAPRRGLRALLGARVVDGNVETTLQVPDAAAAWIEDSIPGVWHLDVEGLLKLTVRQDADRIEALYARTPLLAAAGLGGGRYEFEGATLRAIR